MGKGHKRPATPSPATPPLELPLEDTAPGPPAPDAGPDGMSGSWSMKFNKSLATGKKTLGQVVPKYAQTK